MMRVRLLWLLFLLPVTVACRREEAPGYMAFMAFDPERPLGFVVLFNHSGGLK